MMILCLLSALGFFVEDPAVSIVLKDWSPEKGYRTEWRFSIDADAKEGKLEVVADAGETTGPKKAAFSREKLKTFLEKLEKTQAWTVKTNRCKCPHEGYGITLKVGDKEHDYSVNWNRAKEQKKAYEEVFELVTRFCEERLGEQK